MVLPEKEYAMCKRYEQYINENGIPRNEDAIASCAETLGISIAKLDKLIACKICTPICDGLSYTDEDGLAKQVDLPDDSYNDDSLCESCDSASFIENASSKLSHKEKELLFLYYGISGQQMNYDQIGKKYHKNKQWAHREVQKALGKLQSSTSIQAFGNRMAV